MNKLQLYLAASAAAAKSTEKDIAGNPERTEEVINEFWKATGAAIDHKPYFRSVVNSLHGTFMALRDTPLEP